MEINQLILSDISARLIVLADSRKGVRGARPKTWGMVEVTSWEDLIPQFNEVITTGITRKSQFVNTATRIGGIILDELNLPYETETAVHMGVWIIESYDNLNLINLALDKLSNDDEAYYLVAGGGDYEALVAGVEPVGTNYPRLTPYADWAGGYHEENGLPFIKNGKPSLLNRINLEDHGLVIDAVNKLQRGGWLINQPVWEVFKHFYDKGRGYGKIFPHQDTTKTRVSRSGLKTEAMCIVKGVEKVQDQVFYHQYNVDFRGRIYPMSAFLNEQSSDRSKGLMKFAEAQPLGEQGLYWLMVHAANVWGEDKLTLDERVHFVENQLDIWMVWAKNPIEYTGWMGADKPWSFLAVIKELEQIAEAENPEEFESNLPIFVDGSNNGVQHMTALVRDETTAPLVNLVPTEEPGDVYMAICKKVYAQVQADWDPALDGPFLDFYEEYQVRRSAAKTKAERDELKEWIMEENPMQYAPNYFMGIQDDKIRRKMVKRPVMTLGYGGTRYGFSKMLLEDNKLTNEYMAHMMPTWAKYFGDLIYYCSRGGKKMEAALPGLAKSLSLFEGLAADTAKQDRKFGWAVPITNFPVVQQYRKPQKGRVKVFYKGVRLRLSVLVFEDQRINVAKQKSSAAPNVIHSFDAAHLQMCVVSCNYRVATIHDSFGCLPGDMEDLFVTVRETFVDFYEADPLRQLLTQHDRLDLLPEYGTLDIEDIMGSEYAFA